MLSRVASLVYWMARYVERADNAARILEAEAMLALDHGHSSASLWQAPLATAGDLDHFRALHGEPTAESALQFLLFAPENPNSVLSCIASARENARGAREILPADLMTALNRIYWQLKEAAALGIPKSPPAELLENVRLGCALTTGLIEASLSRAEAWHFARLGRMLERADQTSRLIDVKFFLMFPVAASSDSMEEARWMALLRSASALEMYRRKLGKLSPDEVARFLIFDRHFPRSLRHCLDAAEQSLKVLAGEAEDSEPVKVLGALRSLLLYGPEEAYLRSDLHAALDAFQISLIKVGEAIDTAFFSQRKVPLRSLSPGPQDIQSREAQQQ